VTVLFGFHLVVIKRKIAPSYLSKSVRRYKDCSLFCIYRDRRCRHLSVCI